jgi:hypothetical protein
MTWYGWVRRRKGASWERVCQAPTLGECSKRLGRIARERGVRDKDSCMTSGAAPPDGVSERPTSTSTSTTTR